MGCAAQSGGMAGGEPPKVSAPAPQASVSQPGLTITQPRTMSDVPNEFEVCMDIQGYVVEPAKNGVNAGKGHHHLLVDVGLPADLSQPLAKDEHHIHMGDGSTCKTLKLDNGQHTITAVFAQGNHVPYNPPVTAAITVKVGPAS